LKTTKIVYYAATGVLSLMMLGSAGLYIFNHVEVMEIFTRLGFPTYIIYPLAAAKILGLIAIWANVSRILKEWAYAGFFFNFVLALSAHLHAGDGEFGLAAAALLALVVSYVADKKMSV
jgi:hypothetical protein